MIYLVPIQKKFKPTEQPKQHLVSGSHRKSRCGNVWLIDERYRHKREEDMIIPTCRKCKAMVNGKWRLHGYDFV